MGGIAQESKSAMPGTWSFGYDGQNGRVRLDVEVLARIDVNISAARQLRLTYNVVKSAGSERRDTKICWELAHRGWEVQQPPTPSCRGAAGVDRMFGVLKTGALQHFRHAMPPPPPTCPTQLPPLR